MREHIVVQFRPSLILFLGQAGQQVYDYYNAYLTNGLHKILLQGVGLLQVAYDTATGLATGKLLPVGLRQPSFVPPEDENEVPLPIIFDYALRDVQHNSRHLDIQRAGFPVPNPRTQIYIVADSQDAGLPGVLRTVNEHLRTLDISTMVCHVLDVSLKYNSSVSRKTDIVSKNAGYWEHREIPWFCYVYEHMIRNPHPRFLTANEARYAIAEALFTLTATGITISTLFEEEIRIRPNLDEYTNIGSLSTSAVLFPRAAINNYCNAHLGIELTKNWLSDLQQGTLTREEIKNQHKQARTEATNIRTWMEERDLRPATEEYIEPIGYKWPTLAILGEPQYFEGRRVPFEVSRLLDDLVNRTEVLFTLFSYEGIEEEFKKKQKKQQYMVTYLSWNELAHERTRAAINAFQEWRITADKAWKQAGEAITSYVKTIADTTWPQSDKGFALAREFFDELDLRLHRLADVIARWRTEHERRLKEALNEFNLRSLGPWGTEDQPNIFGHNASSAPKQARPTVDLSPASPPLPDLDDIILDDTPESQEEEDALENSLSPDEEDIRLRLERRVTWTQDMVPPVGTLLMLGIALWFLLTLAEYSWLSTIDFLPAVLPIQWLASIVTALLVGLWNWSFLESRKRDVIKAQKDLLAFCTFCYASRCERYEDGLRSLVLSPLMDLVESMRVRLHNMNNFVSNLQKSLRTQMQYEVDTLFTSPAFARDVLVCNGEQLSKEGKNTLGDIANHIRNKRMTDSVVDWHKSPNTLKRELIRRFKDTAQNILEMSEEEVLQQLDQFTQEINSEYLRGPLVSIQAALDKPEIWREVLERARKVLYSSRVGIGEPRLLLICGREQDVAKGERHSIPNDAIYTHTTNPDWLLVAAFFKGEPWLKLDFDHLFPLPDTRPEDAGMSVDTSNDDSDDDGDRSNTDGSDGSNTDDTNDRGNSSSNKDDLATGDSWDLDLDI